MTVPRGTNFRAAVVTARLLESDLEFHSVLRQDSDLSLYGGGKGPDDTPRGEMQIWWEVEIEARDWGVKDISVFISRLVLDGFYEAPDEAGYDNPTGEEFHYKYPEQKESADIGPDVDAPTPDNIHRLAQPKWTLVYKVGSKNEGRMILTPNAEVDLDKHRIEIEF